RDSARAAGRGCTGRDTATAPTCATQRGVVRDTTTSGGILPPPLLADLHRPAWRVAVVARQVDTVFVLVRPVQRLDQLDRATGPVAHDARHADERGADIDAQVLRDLDA